MQINEVKVNCSKVTGDTNIANEFNNFFSTIGPRLANDITPTDFDPLSCVTPASKVFEFKNITYLELERVLTEAKACKASGLDKISNKLLKAAGNTIIESLAYIFNLSFSTGIFPDEIKFAKLPLFTKQVRNLTVVTTYLYL
jgi:hypothetical protein